MKKSSMKTVGHRGFPQHYPENTLLGFRKAIEAGCDALECDVQFSANGDAYVCHDLSLTRCAGVDAPVCELSNAELAQISVHEPGRLGEHYAPTPMPRLADLVELVQAVANVQLFVELKKESFDYFSREHCLASVLELTSPIRARTTLISFDLPVLKLLNASGQAESAFGWVLSSYDDLTLEQAVSLKPDVLIIDKRKLEARTLWSGPWQWFVYDVVDPEEVIELNQRGVEWIETWDVAALKTKGSAQ